MHMWNRLVAALSFTLMAGVAAAETYPTRPITFVVPYSAGGGTDIMARLIAEGLHKEWGQPVVVENRPGAGGNIGANRVAHSAADGYTVLVTAGALAIAPALYKHLGYDPLKDFVPVTQIATVPLLVVTSSDSPLNSIADLIALAKKDGANVTYATFGVQSPSSMAGGSIRHLAGVAMTEVPFKGSSAALPDVLAGRMTVGIFDTVSVTPMVKGSRLKALAITGPRRAPALPNVPTLVESGIAFDTVGWHAVFVPAATPPAVVAKLNTAINKTLALPKLRNTIAENGSIPIEPPTTVAQWTKQFRDDVPAWDKVVRSLQIKPID